ncbi:hypothetical protein ES288_D09G009100v1 [Gossypium darwinii]|uniref:Uncharacterized protein n=1 Tax=Gossypium darwinii TaxID=34276 RepID=A0A5D2B7Y7_GOSDA|nr:hypothetical protein ES288_D09G009100v1 [Gossypium darwinii]
MIRSDSCPLPVTIVGKSLEDDGPSNVCNL